MPEVHEPAAADHMTSRRGGAIVLAALMGLLPMQPAGAARAGSFDSYTYRNARGTLSYKVYVPGSNAARALPLVVHLHGANETAEKSAARTRWNEVASRHGFLVAYPEANPDYDGARRWDWAGSAREGRGSRDGSLIAGITTTVMRRWHVDRRRVFVIGISTGAGMANVMAVLYPELYSAVGVYAGCLFDGIRCGGSTMDENESGTLAFRTMGRRAHVIPAFVVYGDADPVAAATGSDQVVGQWLVSDDWLDDRRNNGSVARSPSRTRSGRVESTGGHTYDVDVYAGHGGCVLAERWLVHGMGHAWSAGGNGSGLPVDPVTDPAGPDITTAAWRFFAANPMRASTRC